MLQARIGSESYCVSGLETYFYPFRKQMIGIDQTFMTAYGKKEILYADWMASGRLFRPIENKLTDVYGPFVANTHTESNVTGTTMTLAYKHARDIIKSHVHADECDVLLTGGSGMTAMVNKLQRLLGLKVPNHLREKLLLPEEERPIIFVTHMEHHSNQLSWMETIGDVVIVEPDQQGLVDPEQLERKLRGYQNRKFKIGAFTACSNVTGVQTPYHALSRKMHEYGGLCFIDFSASAPYVDINMHPAHPLEKLDAIYFSPHKFLGGPGASGVLIVDSRLISSPVPDHPGGGTVLWSNPWGGKRYNWDMESREDGGTPGFLQTIRTALCITLKEKMGTQQMQHREWEMLDILLPKLGRIHGLHVLDGHISERKGIVSFYLENIHYNLMVRLLNDRYGIQTRGGCSCAGTFGHYLFNLNQTLSKQITDTIDTGDLSYKPGWVRISLHPIMTNSEIEYIIHAIRDIMQNIEEYRKDYVYHPGNNEFHHVKSVSNPPVEQWFSW
ncbi:selenocysteine lyase/cysteine desulfurase [Paenibacillus anaericanus]|uniref:aminotransferase class V-fold PLP-dependent enzyme n=1 Tax=Paenibacillus anaericanus TaxID=170367 RepID=UPI00277FD37A|nr:aminotransferase class V-fold PLP-dependent enzyme [Paenibacillus anaericanus]MDQ0089535.1 selenocysteine lyase/cysteine desulfurase [Paenibacillus anaericanus]